QILASSRLDGLQSLKALRGSDSLQDLRASELDIFRVHFFRASLFSTCTFRT
ncbi:hypothetical protein A2U01_0108305, partial [Trifolium medium]|nr:hypothetical protein [Trifolium medium]